MTIKRDLSLLSVLFSVAVFVLACHSQTASSVDTQQHTNTGSLEATRNMTTARAAHTATLLNSGKVFITGGFVSNGEGLSTTELFDPAVSSFSPGQNMSIGRNSHTATLLPSGKVLIAGGFNGDYLKSAEVYDPQTNTFTSTQPMTTGRSGHVAILLNNGKVLIVGGVGSGWTFLSDAEIFDPVTNSFHRTGSMRTAREGHAVSMLNDGRILITGGHSGHRRNLVINKDSEVFDPSTDKFTSIGNLTVKRHKHESISLTDGKVLILGGSDERDANGAYNNAEIFDPQTNTFHKIANTMQNARYKFQGTAVLLQNGTVLIAGGADNAEIFDPKTKSFKAVPGDMGNRKLFATATKLANGQVLLLGGYNRDIAVSNSAWLYRS